MGAFSEGQQEGTALCPKAIPLPEDDPNIMLLLCQLLHFYITEKTVLHDLPASQLAQTVFQLAVVIDKYDCIGAFELKGEALLGRCAILTDNETLSFTSMADLATAAYLLRQDVFFSLFTRRMIINYADSFSTLERTDKVSLPPVTLCEISSICMDCAASANSY